MLKICQVIYHISRTARNQAKKNEARRPRQIHPGPPLPSLTPGHFSSVATELPSRGPRWLLHLLSHMCLDQQEGIWKWKRKAAPFPLGQDLEMEHITSSHIDLSECHVATPSYKEAGISDFFWEAMCPAKILKCYYSRKKGRIER